MVRRRIEVAYTRDEIIEMLGETLKDKKNIAQLYNDKTINYRGETKDTKELYTEIISERLVMEMEDEDLFEKNITQINRDDYKIPSHYGEISITDTNRSEENMAKNLLWTSIGYLGDIFDFQVPLKGEQVDKAGKIDLISYANDESTAYIIELKTENNKNETLLRAILEIHTYYCQINKEKFLGSFEQYKSLEPKDIKKAVLLEEGSLAHKEYCEKKLRDRPKLRALIEKLDIDIFSFKVNVEKLY